MLVSTTVVSTRRPQEHPRSTAKTLSLVGDHRPQTLALHCQTGFARRTEERHGRQVVFRVPPAEADDVQHVAVPDGYMIKRVDEWEAPGGSRWGLYAVIPRPPPGALRR